MGNVNRIPCGNCGLLMLPETGERTGGVCMRCAGAGRDDLQIRQRNQRKPTLRTKKRSTSLSVLDLDTYPAWILGSLDEDMVRPCHADALPHYGHVVVSATYTFADGSNHRGALSVIRTPGAVGFCRPVLLSSGRRVDIPDGWPQFNFSGVTFTSDVRSDALAELFRREFLQNLARAERHIGKPLDQVFPMKFRLEAALNGGEVTCIIPLPKFNLPIALGLSASAGNDLVKVQNELEVDGGRWIVGVASAYSDRRDLLNALQSEYARWCAAEDATLKRIDVLLFAREQDPSHEELVRFLVDRWNSAMKLQSQVVLSIWAGSVDRAWFGFTSEGGRRRSHTL